MTLEKKREEDWVETIKPDGSKYMASPAFIRKLLKVPTVADLEALLFRVSNLERELNETKYRVNEIERPYRKDKIITYMNENPGFHTFKFYERRIWPAIKESDFEELLKQGKIERKPIKYRVLFGLLQEVDKQ